MTKPTFSSVTEQPCECGYLQRMADDPDFPIAFNGYLYEFEYPEPLEGQPDGKATLQIYHCPFCGGKAPASHREPCFAQISTAEASRLDELLGDLKDIAEVIRVLGPPDADFAQGVVHRVLERDGQPPARTSYRSLTYQELSPTVDVVFVDYVECGIRYRLQGKWLGKNS